MAQVMKSVVLFSFIILFAVHAQKQWEPLTPDETYFIYTRCMEDNFGNDYALINKWLKLDLDPNDAKTACFVKCVLEKMELYDPKTNSFTPENIVAQQEKYSECTNATGEQAVAVRDAMCAATVSGNDCKSVFKAFLPVLASHADVLGRILLANKEVARAVFEHDTTIKKKNESVFRYCEKKFFADGSDHLCKKRHGQIPEIQELPSYMECILKELRYIDRCGEPNPEEVKRDFHEIGVADKDAEIDQMFAKCGTDMQSFYKCLWGTTGEFKKKSMEALDYREIRSMNYAYKLNPKTPPYNAEAIKAKVVELDVAAGCPPSP